MFPLRDSTHLNYLSQNVTFSHLLFGRVSLGRKRRHKQIARLRNKCAMTCIGDMNQNSFTNMVCSLFTTHHSLIHNDMDFSRFTSHLMLRVLIQTLHLVIYPTNNFKSAEPKRITPTTIATTEANITAPAEISFAIPTNLEYRL